MSRKVTVATLIAVAAAALVVVYLKSGSGHDKAKVSKTQAAGEKKGPVRVAKQRKANLNEERIPLQDDDPEGELVLEGIVLSADDEPVAGAVVSLDAVPRRVVRSGQDGSFAFAKLIGRPYQLAARSPQGVAGPVPVRLTSTSEPVQIRLRPAAKVAVSVTLARENRPLAGATVELRGLDFQSGNTDTDGKSRFAPVIPGRYSVVAYAPGFAKQSSWVRVTGDSDETTVKLALRRGARVSGTVVDKAGQPVVGARVIYSGQSSWGIQADERYDAAETDKNGKYEFEALVGGSYRFTARHQDYAPGGTALVELDGSNEKAGVDIQLEDAASVYGTVLRADGAPSVGARVRISQAVAGMRWNQEVRQAFSDDEGRYEMSGLPRETLELVAMSDEGGSELVEIDASGAQAKHKVDLAISITETIAGIVVDTAGEPLEGVQVSARPDMRSGGSWARMRLRGFPRELTDAGGQFVIRGLDPGTYRVAAAPAGVRRGRGWLRRGEPVETGTQGVRLVLEKDGSIKGVVEYEDGKAPPAFTVKLGFGVESLVANPDGEFSLDNVPPQTYTVSITGPGFAGVQLGNTVVKPGETVDLGTIKVVKGRVIAGTVTRDGTPVEGALVRAGRQLFGDGGSTKAAFKPPWVKPAKETTTDENGKFRLSGFALRDVSIVAEHEDKGRSASLLLPATNDSVTGLELQLQAFGSLRGTVTKGGQPAASVRVGAAPQSAPDTTFGVMSGPDGAFVLDKLAPDTYRVSALGGNFMQGMGFYAKTVQVTSGQTSTVDLNVDGGSLTVTVDMQSDEPPGMVIAWAFTAVVTATTYREVELASASSGASSSNLRFSMPGMPLTFSELFPGKYTICITAYPTEVNSFPLMGPYSDREGDSLPASCQVTTLASSPTEQTVSIPVQVPDYVPGD